MGILDFRFWILGILDFGDFGFSILDSGPWILDRYVAILYVRPPTPQILDFGGRFGILDFGDFGFRILGILDFGSWGFWILDFGALGILDFGFWGRNPKSKIPQSKIQKIGFWTVMYQIFLWPQISGILDFGF